MSTPPVKSRPAHTQLGLFNAILVGLVLGLIAVTSVRYFLPERETGGKKHARTEARKPTNQAQLPKPLPPGQAEPAASDVERASAEKAASEAQPGKGDEQTKVPAAPETGTSDTKAEPVLVPATSLQFPKPFSESDITAALQPLLSFRASDGDAAAIKEVVAAASRKDGDAARQAVGKITDTAAKAFAEWIMLRSSTGNLDEALEFGKTHPLFPPHVQDPVTERSLFLSDAPGSEILRFYASRVPVTAPGKASLGGALIETGERQRGLELIKFVWSRYALDPVVEQRFLARYGEMLDEKDRNRHELLVQARAKQHDDPARSAPGFSTRGIKGAARLNQRRGRALHGIRSPQQWKKNGKRQRTEITHRQPTREAAANGKMPELSSAPSLLKHAGMKKEDAEGNANAQNEPSKAAKESPTQNLPEQNKAAPQQNQPEKARTEQEKLPDKNGKAAIKETKPAQNTAQAKAAAKAFKLVKEATGGPSTLFLRLRALRREGADDDLWSLLRSINPANADLADPDRWWDLRRDEIRLALNDDHPKTAYAIAIAHGPLDDDSRSEAEFLAGWIALRFLKDPKRAQTHFEASLAAKGSGREEARAAYWLGRAKSDLGLRAGALASFQQAAERFYTYYGALARQQLGKGQACAFRAPARPSQAAIERFLGEQAFKSLLIAKQLDLQPLFAALIADLPRQIDDPEQMTLLLELVERIAPPHLAVRAGKAALFKGFAAEAYAFPTLLPKFDQAGANDKLEIALLNALTRQESEFYTGSISRAGARGLMQLMPQTARLVAATHKIKYELPKLLSDPSYNVTLGSAFLAQLISGYNGSYLLALAAYNAGPGRIAQWLDDFGDPRTKAVDPIDWIERIPFAETRNYVQRILESTQLYRCRLESNKTRSQIVEDLHRGRPGKVPDFVNVSGSGELDQAQ